MLTAPFQPSKTTISGLRPIPGEHFLSENRRSICLATALQERVVEPEILDSLPEDAPEARANRRDIRRINFFMGSFRWFRRNLQGLVQPDDRLLEIGAGAGDLGLYLRNHDTTRFAPLAGLDLCSRPGRWPAEWEWFQTDIMKFADWRHHSIIIANLLLHQFDDITLRRLGPSLRSARALLFVEPARYRIHQHQLKLLIPLGLHPVSRHDGHVSIAAGFRGDELPNLLGLEPDEWRIRISTTLLGAYRLFAVRRENASQNTNTR